MLQFNKKIQIGTKEISEDAPVFIIAEAGVNHNGDMSQAEQMISLAVEAGADAVKFQTFRAEHLILKTVNKAPYQCDTTDAAESQYDMLKRLEVTETQNKHLKKCCEDQGIIFLTTPFDECSLHELDALNLDAYKVASTDTTNIPFLQKIARRQKPIIFSTGMSFLDEVNTALKALHAINQNVIVLQCSANYPIRDDEAHLAVLRTFRKEWDILCGYSDHSVGVGAGSYAVALGARVIEKHFTLDKSLEGPDHRASLDPLELKVFVEDIRCVERYLGSEVKEPTVAEQATRKSLQKCFVSACPIARGEIFSEENIVGKRTGGVGVSPIEYKEIFGKKADRDYQMNDIVEIPK